MAQYVLQDTAVLEVVELIGRIDAANQRYALERAVRGHDFGNEPLVRLQIAVQTADRNGFVALEPKCLPGRSFLEHKWDHAHSDQVGAMDAFERLRDDGANPEQGGAFGGPVA